MTVTYPFNYKVEILVTKDTAESKYLIMNVPVTNETMTKIADIAVDYITNKIKLTQSNSIWNKLLGLVV